MSTAAEHALADLALIRADHDTAHRCADGGWYNPHVLGGTYCPTWKRLYHISEQIETLHHAAAAAAEDPAAVTAVAEAMTGLTMSELDEESREGWETTARDAMLATHLWVTTGHAREVPVLDLHAADTDAEAVRYAAAVEEWSNHA